ncbi:MAG: isoaspartyl peptidase/L-asparaginase family protein [Deltaproteobacteria bacterium]|nr:isoaspartyl peptidase/L-asparaginase family protein [Deltaproteobacteria bacterium]
MVSSQPAIIVHGGAGRGSGERREARLAGCGEAALVGWQVVQAGGQALDAVEAAVATLEDDPLFNAGTGSSLNRDGEVEMDAAVMSGTLQAGAVAAVSGIRNPIRLARKVLEDGRHVLLAGPGAREFARRAGISPVPPETLVTPAQRDRWEESHGTVGCVAVDRNGRIAAGTSTGGTPGKLPGRVGDSPLIGCGTYANPAGAASCTGEGEAIIKVLLAKTSVDLMDSGAGPAEAARRAVALLARQTSGQAGVILADRSGAVGYAHNAEEMPVCYIVEGEEPVTAS